MVVLDCEYFNDGREIHYRISGGVVSIPRSGSPVRVEWTPETAPLMPCDRLRRLHLQVNTPLAWNPEDKILSIGDVAAWHKRRALGAVA